MLHQTFPHALAFKVNLFSHSELFQFMVPTWAASSTLFLSSNFLVIFFPLILYLSEVGAETELQCYQEARSGEIHSTPGAAACPRNHGTGTHRF